MGRNNHQIIAKIPAEAAANNEAYKSSYNNPNSITASSKSLEELRELEALIIMDKMNYTSLADIHAVMEELEDVLKEITEENKILLDR